MEANIMASELIGRLLGQAIYDGDDEATWVLARVAEQLWQHRYTP